MNSRDAIKMDSLKHYGFGPEVMKQIKVCPQCGAKANAKQHFCRECGAELPTDTLYEKYRRSHRACTMCDKVIPNTAEYCPHCGAKTARVG